MTEPEPCWACAGPTRPTDTLAPHPFLACAACGLRFRPDVTPEAAQAVYATGDYGAGLHEQVYISPETMPQRRREARMRLAFATGGVRPDARLLDIGAAGGIFVDEARRAGWPADGVEPDPAFVAYARDAIGVELTRGTIETFDPPSRSLDVVTMWHVLEHIARPLPQLQRVREWLAPGGRLVVEVPNAASAPARTLGPAWPAAQPDVHVAQYTPRALERLMQRAGYEVAVLRTLPGDHYYRLRERLAPANLAHVAKWRWRRGGGELLVVRAQPRAGA